MKSEKQRAGRQVTGRLLRRFFLEMFLGLVVLGVILLAAYVICANRIWYESTPFYFLVHFVHYHWAACFWFSILLYVLVNCCRYFRIFAGLLAAVVEAVSEVYEEKEKVSLPPELDEVEQQLNKVLVEVKQSRLTAEEAEQRKNNLIVYMAHDLKTPLTSVIGYLSLLHDEKEISPPLREKYLGIALKKAQRLEELINQFFEITRFNLSHMELELSRINMSLMLEQEISEFQPMFAEKNLTCSTLISRDIYLSCDVDKMERVFDNLIKNAVNYSYEGTKILLQAKPLKQEGMELIITNHGKTIPPEKLERIFEQFYRMESARTSSTGGSGIGLAIAREIVQQHGGTLVCESENETIRFILRMEGKI